MGNVFLSQSEYTKALNLYKESIQIQAKLYGTRKHVGIAQILNNIASGAILHGDHDQAMEFYKEPLSIDFEVYETLERADVVKIPNNMASVAYSNDDQGTALQFYGSGTCD
ncbi:hypothetical protein BJ742DRAFT_881580 [Cladochytrium replicatum]|nr:hypothetical protein BJ742DRAFT_881580 [Cladochytrium replicatum]